MAMGPMDGLYGAAPKFNTTDDPLGIQLKQRARAAKDAANWQDGSYRPVNPFGPQLPEWDAWFQALQEAAGDKELKMEGGASPIGSHQLRGYSVQPDFLTTDPYFMGRKNAEYGQGTMFAPGQESTITGASYEAPDAEAKQAKVVAGLRKANPKLAEEADTHARTIAPGMRMK